MLRLARRDHHGRDEVAITIRQLGQQLVVAYRDENKVNGEIAGVELVV
jgi:hypothetical protein